MKFAFALVSFLAVVAVSSAQTATDIDVLNFALNLECLEAEFYSYSAFGHGLNDTLRGGGPVTIGGRKAALSPKAQSLAEDIATDEIAHVAFLRAALGSAAVPCPLINIGRAFSTVAKAAGVRKHFNTPFKPYGDDTVFYTGAFIFEDVGVTAYHGALGLLSTPLLVSYASGILGTEAYHAGAIRAKLMAIKKQYVFPYHVKVKNIVDDISNLRAAVGGGNDGGIDQLVPSGSNAIVYSRNTSEVLAIVYLGSASKPGGFFPKGLNGAIK